MYIRGGEEEEEEELTMSLSHLFIDLASRTAVGLLAVLLMCT